VVATERGAALAHAALVPRRLEAGGRALRAGYVEAVATHPARRRAGLGSRVVGELSRLVASGFELGALSTGAHAFYARLGWERWRGPTYVRDGARLLRSPGDDDGIMVLRTGATRGLDLAAPIVCEARRGDAW
jgi:aminoglycoside 2'-N-acetyltransferase I